MEHLRYKPNGFWLLDDTAPFQDYSGYSRSATLAGTESHGISLSSYPKFSQLVGDNATITFDSPVYNPGQELDSFSIAVCAYIVNPGGEIVVIGSKNSLDGIVVVGNILFFVMNYTNTGPAVCSYTLPDNQKLDIVAVHTPQKNTLYLNGVQVAEIDITSDQIADTFMTSDNNLYSGYVAGNTSALINSVALYQSALNVDDVVRIYQANNRKLDGSVPKPFGGEDIPISSIVRAPYLNTGWTKYEDWNAATSINTSIEDTRLVAQKDGDLTVLGTWNDSVDLYYAGVATPIDNVVMFWDGLNETVLASVDGGATYIQVTKGVPLSNIPSGFDPTDKSLYIQVNLSNGADQAYIENLNVKGWLTNNIVSAHRTITYPSGAGTFDEYNPLILHDRWGVDLNGGTLLVGPDTSDSPISAQTIEIWVKQGTGSALTRGMPSAASAYTNGNAYTPPPIGQWSVLHFVLSSPLTAQFSLTGDVQIGKIAIYPTALTATQISQIVTEYTGVILDSPGSNGLVRVQETEPTAIFFPYDWSIESA